MTPYSEFGKEELLKLKEELTLQYEDAKGKGLKLDMSRGKPAPAQLDMTMPMMDIFTSHADMRTSRVWIRETMVAWKEFTEHAACWVRCWVWTRSTLLYLVPQA